MPETPMSDGHEVCRFTLAGPDDAEAISRLAKAIWWDCYPPHILTAREVAHFWPRGYQPGILREEMAAGAVFEWIEAEGQRCGFLAYRGEPGGVRMRLCKLYLVPECHGRGYGARALARVQTVAKEGGFREIGLYVFKRNTKAIRAYARAGFVVERAELFEAGEGFYYDDYIMVCRLGAEQGMDTAPSPAADF